MAWFTGWDKLFYSYEPFQMVVSGGVDIIWSQAFLQQDLSELDSRLVLGVKIRRVILKAIQGFVECQFEDDYIVRLAANSVTLSCSIQQVAKKTVYDL